MILIELTAAINAAGDTRTFYVSTDRFVTSPTDTPPNTAFIPALTDPGSIGVHAFSDGRTGGATALELGSIELANGDGQFDAWLGYSFDGRPVVIRSGPSGGAYPGDFPAIATLTAQSIEAAWTTITVNLRDKQFIFDRPVQTTLYAGNNVLPAGLEGTSSDLLGKPKPRVYGKVFNISPPCVNTSKLTYQVNDGVVQDISAVYDQGVSLTKGSDFASSTLLQAASPSAGTYITCFAEGYFRLGSSPAGQVTSDVIQGATSANRTVAQVLKQLAVAAGVAI